MYIHRKKRELSSTIILSVEFSLILTKFYALYKIVTKLCIIFSSTEMKYIM